MANTPQERRVFRKKRVRKKVIGTPERPRLSVYRSLKHIHAQLIDDMHGSTLACASTQEAALRDQKVKAGVEGARRLGELIAQRAKEKNVTAIVFDRGSFQYHGQVKAVAEGARAGGLKF